jgi:hypothetical protein
MDVGNVANVSETRVSNFIAGVSHSDPKNGGSLYFRNVNNIVHIHTE